MQIGSSCVIARACKPYTILLDRLLHGISTRSIGLGKAEVIIRAHIERLGSRAGEFKGIIEVVGFPIDQCDVPARNASDRSCEAVVDAHLQPPDVEIVEVTIQSGITISRLQMCIMLLSEALPKVVTDVPKYD